MSILDRMQKKETTPAARFAEAAAIVAGWPRLWAILLAEHVAGPDGRCRGCAGGVQAAPRWPCRLAGLAEAAQSIHRVRAAAAPPRRPH